MLSPDMLSARMIGPRLTLACMGTGRRRGQGQDARHSANGRLGRGHTPPGRAELPARSEVRAQSATMSPANITTMTSARQARGVRTTLRSHVARMASSIRPDASTSKTIASPGVVAAMSGPPPVPCRVTGYGAGSGELTTKRLTPCTEVFLMPLPTMTPEQRSDALAKATAARSARSELLAKVKSGELTAKRSSSATMRSRRRPG